jgi:hypothetical protein
MLGSCKRFLLVCAQFMTESKLCLLARTISDGLGERLGERRAARHSRAACALCAVRNSPAPRAFGGRPRRAGAVDPPRTPPRTPGWSRRERATALRAVQPGTATRAYCFGWVCSSCATARRTSWISSCGTTTERADGTRRALTLQFTACNMGPPETSPRLGPRMGASISSAHKQ